MPAKKTTTKNTPTAKTTASDLGFKADAHTSGDIYQPLPNVPSISETEAEKRSNEIQGQRRALAVAFERTNAAADAFKLEGATAVAQTEATKAQTKWAKLAEAQTGLQIAQLSGQTLEQVKLQAMASLTHEQAATTLHGQTLELRAKGMTAGYQHAQTLFEIQGATYAQEVAMVQNKLAARSEQAAKLKAAP